MVTATQMHALRLRISRSIGDSNPLMLCLENSESTLEDFQISAATAGSG